MHSVHEGAEGGHSHIFASADTGGVCRVRYARVVYVLG